MNYRPFANTPTDQHCGQHCGQHSGNRQRDFWQNLFSPKSGHGGRIRGIGRMGVRHGSLLLLTCLLLAGCWGDEEPAPEATQAVAEAPVSGLPTSAATASEAAAPTDTGPTDTGIAATPEGIAAISATPVAENGATTATTTSMTSATVATVATVAPTATFVPLSAEEADNCEIKSSIDFGGYPQLEQRMGCATEAAVFDPIGINEFGEGDEPVNRFMLWFSSEGNIYVLFPDGHYETHEDTWVEGVDPNYACNPLGGEEDSPPLPRRGFGKLWCSSPELQAIMGPVPREERLCQYAVLQRFETGRLLACFEDATIRYFRLLDDSTWDLQVQ